MGEKIGNHEKKNELDVEKIITVRPDTILKSLHVY